VPPGQIIPAVRTYFAEITSVAATRHRALPQIVQHLAGNMLPKRARLRDRGRLPLPCLDYLTQATARKLPSSEWSITQNSLPSGSHHDKSAPSGYGHSSTHAAPSSASRSM
jgi:hypothetical protein